MQQISSRFWDRLTIGAFLCFILIPAILMFLSPPATVSTVEKRSLAKFPTLNGQPIEEYFLDLESYINDHFGLREQFIFWNSYIEMVWLRQSPNPEVLVGVDNWLFLNLDDMLHDFQGLVAFDDEELVRWQTALEGRRDWFAERGIQYFFVVAPEKQTIYPEYMPPQYVRTGTTRLDQLIAHMEANSDLRVIDLRETLWEAKDEGQLYYNYDTHWNHLGAYYGYRSLAEQLTGAIPPSEIFSLEDMEEVRGNIEDELGSMAGLPGVFSYQRINYRPQMPCTSRIEYAGPIPDALLENPRHFQCPERAHRAIIVHDSFFAALIQSMAQHFGETHYFFGTLSEMRNFEEVLDYIQPDFVIEEIVERKLSNVPDDEAISLFTGEM